MFKKFFGDAKQGGGKGAKGQEAEADGGFFNLPAPTPGAGPPAAENAPPAVAPPAAAENTDNGGSMFSGIDIKQPQSPSDGGGLFGDLSVKASVQQPAQSASPQTTAKMDGGGSSGSSGSSMFGDLQIKASTDQSEPMGGGGGGGMFDGMAVKTTKPDAPPDAGGLFGALSVKSMSPSPTSSPSSGPSPSSGMGVSHRKKQEPVRDVAKALSRPGAPALDALAGNATQMRPQSGNKARKKKKSGFRPGFGRDLTVAESADLQRGAVDAAAVQQDPAPENTADVSSAFSFADSSPNIAEEPAAVAAVAPADKPVDAPLYTHEEPPAQRAGESEDEAQSPKYASSAPELAKAAPIDGNKHTGGTSMLAGLTIHAQAPAVPANEVPRKPVPISGGLLSGLSVRSDTGGRGNVTGTRAEPLRPDATSRHEKNEAVPASTEQRLHQHLAQFKDSAMRFRQQLGEISQGTARVAENKILLSKDLIQNKMELQKAEIAQEAASESEDFQQADSLNSVIAAATHKIKANQTSLKQQTEEASHLETEKSLLSQQQLAATTSLMDELSSFSETKAAEMEKVSKSSKKKHEQEQQRLATEEERIQLQVRHIELDNKHLEDEQQQTDAAISDQSKEISERRYHTTSHSTTGTILPRTLLLVPYYLALYYWYHITSHSTTGTILPRYHTTSHSTTGTILPRTLLLVPYYLALYNWYHITSHSSTGNILPRTLLLVPYYLALYYWYHTTSHSTTGT
jgi:hypothetical protein